MKAILTIITAIACISIGANFWQYYHPRTITAKGETVYLPSLEQNPTIVYKLPEGNQSATAEIEKEYKEKSASAKELVDLVKSIPNLEKDKEIANLTSVKANLELKMHEKDLILNDKENQVKQWQDKYNSVTVNNADNSVDVFSEVSPIIASTEKREKFLAPKIPYTTITSLNPAVKFYGIESYTFKNPIQKNFLEFNLNLEGSLINSKMYPKANAELIFNPNGRLRPYIGYGYYYDILSGRMIEIANGGVKINIIKL